MSVVNGVNKMERLRLLRTEKKLSLRELGEQLNLSFVTIGQYERGERQPDNDILVKLADFFEVSIDYLLERVDDRNLSLKKEEYVIPNNIDTFDQAVVFLKSLNLLRAYGGIDLNQKTEEEVITLARTIHGVLKMQGAL